MIPVKRVVREEEDSHAEQLMFDKAEFAARIGRLRAEREELRAEIEALDIADSDARAREVAWRERQIEHLQNIIDALESD